jgi:hypothetical protein
LALLDGLPVLWSLDGRLLGCVQRGLLRHLDGGLPRCVDGLLDGGLFVGGDGLVRAGHDDIRPGDCRGDFGLDVVTEIVLGLGRTRRLSRRRRNESSSSPMPRLPSGEWYRRIPPRPEICNTGEAAHRDAAQSPAGNITIEIRWCPAHKGVPGNQKADEWAKFAAGKPDARGVEWKKGGARSTPLPTSLAHLKREISEKKWAEA